MRPRGSCPGPSHTSGPLRTTLYVGRIRARFAVDEGWVILIIQDDERAGQTRMRISIQREDLDVDVVKTLSIDEVLKLFGLRLRRAERSCQGTLVDDRPQ